MAQSLSICLRTPTRVTLVTQIRPAKELAVELAVGPATAVKIIQTLTVFKLKLWCCISFRLVYFLLQHHYLILIMKRSILLLISHTCNLSCKYCYEHYKDARKMTYTEAIDILNKEFSLSPDDITSIDLLGGEPLTNFEIIPNLCSWIWNRLPSMQIFIRTNGTLLTKSMKNWFMNNNKLVGLGISVDGTPENNLFNRGIKDLDLDFFRENWPDIPAKFTVFPDSVEKLSESVVFLHDKGFNVIGGIAQGIEWSKDACKELNLQMKNLTKYYIANPSLEPPKPLFSLDFNHSYNYYDSTKLEKPCWARDIVHTYDCDYDLLPCHMFSSLVQGTEGRRTIVNDYLKVTNDICDEECIACPIRWSCVNCMALNYHLYKDFKKNANRILSCNAHKITAYWSAILLTQRAMNGILDLSNSEIRDSITNAIKYIKEYDEFN